MLGDVLTGAGRRVLSNRLGSNVQAGVASCLLGGVTALGKSKFDIAILEMDERSSLKILPFIKPDYMVVTNLFRDSIMRNAHPAYIAGFLDAAPETTKLILNADDPISSRVAPKSPRAYFGIERMATDVTDCVNRINDAPLCPVCGGDWVYEYRRYHHIGRARCADCGYESPAYDYAARDVDLEHRTLCMDGQTYALPSDSAFNLYNTVTVIAVLRELGFSHAELAARLADVKIVESRYNAETAGAVTVVMQMSKDKNALAGSRAFDYAASQPGGKELILMMNCLADQKHWSENVCWLYDCDFEFLNRENITRIVATGPRARDYYLRLLLAGVPEERLRCAERETDAPGLLAYTPGESVYIFYGTDAIDLAYRVRDEAKRLAERAGGAA
jgi:UDP-N-acetylmuramoyl-L-alanyl-D-glutamate--2,6-diaminopimelate ligase